MATLTTNTMTDETELLRQEINALKNRVAQLSEACISISESPDYESALQEVANSV